MRGCLICLVVVFALFFICSCGGVEEKDENALKGDLASPRYMKDTDGRKLRVGNEYVMTGKGLRLVHTRNIQGTVTDQSGKPLSGVKVSIADSDHKTLTQADGSFTFPFAEGYVKLVFDVPGIPSWCHMEDVENLSVSVDKYPSGWDTGVIEVPCDFLGLEDGKARWAEAGGEYIDNGDGTVTDTVNGLMWTAKMPSNGFSWDQANEYCETLVMGEHVDWRLPTPEELETLYHTGIACAWNEPNMISGAMNLWSETVGESSARAFNICSGKAREISDLHHSPDFAVGALAVRSLEE